MSTVALPQQAELKRLVDTLDHAVPCRVEGTIWSVGRSAIEAISLPVPVGAVCPHPSSRSSGNSSRSDWVPRRITLLASLDGSEGIAPGDKVELRDSIATLHVERQ